MSFLSLIQFYDFIQTLHVTRKFYTKIQHFYQYKSFSKISLLQKQRLNPRNYSKYELVMELFV
jgi:hypothetical protein